MTIYRIGVTGHRKLLEKQTIVLDRTKEILSEFKQIHRDNEGIEVNTGMALGFDQLVCDTCLELDIPYVAVVPCDAQDTLWKPQQRQHYAWLLSKAIRVVQVTPGPYEPWKMRARNGWIVKNSNEMVVHWNGFYEGGTGGCMKLVVRANMPWKNTVNLK
jgi:uncharacterized phage-like protein YoqJ